MKNVIDQRLLRLKRHLLGAEMCRFRHRSAALILNHSAARLGRLCL
jgi:hypothetical protein